MSSTAPLSLQPLSIAVRPERDRVVVAPEGELDLATTGPLESEVEALCGRGVPEVCLDLRGLTFFDSSGLHLLLRLDDRLAVHDCRFSLEVGDGAAAHVLRITGLHEHFMSSIRP